MSPVQRSDYFPEHGESAAKFKYIFSAFTHFLSMISDRPMAFDAI